MRKSSTSGFDFADCGMLGGSRPGPVNRHGFGVAGRAGARLAPITGPAPAGWPLSEWRPAPRKLNGGRLDSRCPEAAGEEGGGVAAARWARPAGRIGHRGVSRPVPASAPAPRRRKFFQNSPCIAVRVPVSYFFARGRSSAGRALDWQSRGQGFDPPRLHPSIE